MSIPVNQRSADSTSSPSRAHRLPSSTHRRAILPSHNNLPGSTDEGSARKRLSQTHYCPAPIYLTISTPPLSRASCGNNGPHLAVSPTHRTELQSGEASPPPRPDLISEMEGEKKHATTRTRSSAYRWKFDVSQPPDARQRGLHYSAQTACLTSYFRIRGRTNSSLWLLAFLTEATERSFVYASANLTR